MPEATSKGQILVTGASRGIGAAIARDLVGRGYEVAGLSRSGQAAVGYGLACDVGDAASIKAAVEAAAARGPIVGLVNCAGAHATAPALKLEIEDFESMMHINASSVLMVSQAAHPHLVSSGGGTVVNIGSFFDKLGVPENTAYCASKAAVGAITRCLSVEWAADAISVVNVAPGYIETDLNRDFLGRDKVRAWLQKRIPVGRPGEVSEVARLVGSLFVERITFLTGETIYIDGAQGMNH
jgi:NAD(P)-dependent dehydrogenase (short-subunit alcohol dehydrogenase family)